MAENEKVEINELVKDQVMSFPSVEVYEGLSLKAKEVISRDWWFSEKEVMWPGQRFALRIKKILRDEESEFQHILVFESQSYGNVLVLDGIIQVTERDEFAYQECLANIPLFIHPNPKKVLIIGAGDGGIAREVSRHPDIEAIVNVEIDKGVPEASKDFFKKSLYVGFEHPKVKLLFEDGNKFLRETKDRFDVVIVDSSDPVGPNVTLFENNFYSLIKNVLTENGVMATQGENMWLHLDMIQRSAQRCALSFPTVGYAYACVPSYPSGQIGFMVCSMNSKINLADMQRQIPKLLKPYLRYYSEDMHRAAFDLPPFAKKKLEEFSHNATSHFSTSPNVNTILTRKFSFPKVAVLVGMSVAVSLIVSKLLNPSNSNSSSN